MLNVRQCGEYSSAQFRLCIHILLPMSLTLILTFFLLQVITKESLLAAQVSVCCIHKKKLFLFLGLLNVCSSLCFLGQSVRVMHQ